MINLQISTALSRDGRKVVALCFSDNDEQLSQTLIFSPAEARAAAAAMLRGAAQADNDSGLVDPRGDPISSPEISPALVFRNGKEKRRWPKR